jgi:hypothetical protein
VGLHTSVKSVPSSNPKTSSDVTQRGQYQFPGGTSTRGGLKQWMCHPESHRSHLQEHGSQA